MLRKRYLTLLALLFGMSHASVTLSNTRVVYHADKKESNITVRNNTASPFPVQSWVQGKDSQGTKAPFIVTPPLFAWMQVSPTRYVLSITARLYRRIASRFSGST